MALRFVILWATAMLGAWPARQFKVLFGKRLNYLLAFNGGMLLTLLCVKLLPFAFTAHIEGQTIGMMVLLGFGFQIFLEYLTMGAEHGHLHLHTHSWRKELWLIIGMALHSITDGLPLGLNNTQFDTKGYLSAIAIHKIPEGFILMMLFSHLVNKPYKAWIIMALYATLSPLSMVVASGPQISLYMPYLVAFVSGGLFHVSATILFENNPDIDHHKFNPLKWISILAGSLLAISV